MVDVSTLTIPDELKKTSKTRKGDSTPKTYVMWLKGEPFYDVILDMRKDMDVKKTIELALKTYFKMLADNQK